MSELEEAEARISDYRQRHEIPPAVPRQRQVVAGWAGVLERLKDGPQWECATHGCDWRAYGEPPADHLCDDCRDRQRREAFFSLPKRAALKGSGVPGDHRGRYNLPGTSAPCLINWPRDPRPEWAGVKVEDWPASGGRSVTLAGANGHGKSALAAELLYRCRQAGAESIWWVSWADLCREEREAGYEIHWRMGKARGATALVVDDFGLEVASLASERAWALAAELVDYRHSKLGGWTIYTSHLPLSGGDPNSIKARSRAVYDRLRDGLMLQPISTTTHRGRR